MYFEGKIYLILLPHSQGIQLSKLFGVSQNQLRKLGHWNGALKCINIAPCWEGLLRCLYGKINVFGKGFMNLACFLVCHGTVQWECLSCFARDKLIYGDIELATEF